MRSSVRKRRWRHAPSMVAYHGGGVAVSSLLRSSSEAAPASGTPTRFSTRSASGGSAGAKWSMQGEKHTPSTRNVSSVNACNARGTAAATSMAWPPRAADPSAGGSRYRASTCSARSVDGHVNPSRRHPAAACSAGYVLRSTSKPSSSNSRSVGSSSVSSSSTVQRSDTKVAIAGNVSDTSTARSERSVAPNRASSMRATRIPCRSSSSSARQSRTASQRPDVARSDKARRCLPRMRTHWSKTWVMLASRVRSSSRDSGRMRAAKTRGSPTTLST
mmetsp:Transcript_15307/g.47414  ORF Transcript_15307/g.47414 Transcript_15307/m.47414 type:complete len:275 (+) Transcript_15307:167-991(+)